MTNKYCNSLSYYSRLITREVKIGDIALGGLNPIRIQSMTNTNNADINSSVEQIIKMNIAGSEYVRITIPSKKDLDYLKEIKKQLRIKGYSVPLIADVHFSSDIAEEAAKIVEKVRINPGNYATKIKTNSFDYTEQEYLDELENISYKLLPLIKTCKENGTAIRIGVNHGSLSQRIMSRYGDTPAGMVQSAIEFSQIFQNENFHNLVFSMKSSNVRVMVQSYRLLLNKFYQENNFYPIHLGVTEAGDGNEGRIKSAVGIGSLLEDGIGDTIRISLTEAPEIEPPVAKKLVSQYFYIHSNDNLEDNINLNYNPFEFEQRQINFADKVNFPIVISDLSNSKNIEETLKELNFIKKNNSWIRSDNSPDYLLLNENQLELNTNAKIIVKATCKTDHNFSKYYYSINEYKSEAKKTIINFIEINSDKLEITNEIKSIKDEKIALIISDKYSLQEKRNFLLNLKNDKLNIPVIIKSEKYFTDNETTILQLAAENGIFFIDGLANGLFINSLANNNINFNNDLAFNILQAARVRISKTEFIACPSCGRTQFNILEVLHEVRKKTSHLKGLKIAVMGCIVNGPGEMADADYGYIGAGNDKVNLYRNKNLVLRNVDDSIAVDKLIELIKNDGNWQTPLV